MRLLLFGLLLALQAGCAAHRVQPRTVPTDWAVVRALSPGTDIAVDLGEQQIRYGALQYVSGEGLAIRGRRSLEMLPRERIERLSIRTPTRVSRPIVKTALIAAAISSGLMLYAKAMEENSGPDGGKWTFFAMSTAAGAGIGALRAPQQKFSERLVYMRP